MDIKRILLLLADKNHDGKVDLSDLPGVLVSVVKMQNEVDEFKVALKELAAVNALESQGQSVTPEQLAQLWADAAVPFKTLGEKAAASNAAIEAGK